MVKFNSQNLKLSRKSQNFKRRASTFVTKSRPKSMVSKLRKMEPPVVVKSVDSSSDSDTRKDSILDAGTPRLVIKEAKEEKAAFQRLRTNYEYKKDVEEFRPSLPKKR